MTIIDQDIEFYKASLETYRTKLFSCEEKKEEYYKNIINLNKEIIKNLKSLKESINKI